MGSIVPRKRIAKLPGSVNGGNVDDNKTAAGAGSSLIGKFFSHVSGVVDLHIYWYPVQQPPNLISFCSIELDSHHERGSNSDELRFRLQILLSFYFDAACDP